MVMNYYGNKKNFHDNYRNLYGNWQYLTSNKKNLYSNNKDIYGNYRIYGVVTLEIDASMHDAKAHVHWLRLGDYQRLVPRKDFRLENTGKHRQTQKESKIKERESPPNLLNQENQENHVKSMQGKHICFESMQDPM